MIKGLAERYNNCLIIMLNDMVIATTIYNEYFEIPSILDNYAKLYAFDRQELKGIPTTLIETPKPKLHDVLDGKVALPTEFSWTYNNYHVKISAFGDEFIWFTDKFGCEYKKSRFHCFVHFLE